MRFKWLVLLFFEDPEIVYCLYVKIYVGLYQCAFDGRVRVASANISCYWWNIQSANTSLNWKLGTCHLPKVECLHMSVCVHRGNGLVTMWMRDALLRCYESKNTRRSGADVPRSSKQHAHKCGSIVNILFSDGWQRFVQWSGGGSDCVWQDDV